jgi:hypothetical protein
MNEDSEEDKQALRDLQARIQKQIDAADKALEDLEDEES